MNTKRIISVILILIMLGSAFLTSCRYVTDEGETSWIESSSPEEDSSAKDDGSSSVSSEEAESSDVTEGSNMTDDSDTTEGSSTEDSNSESEGENEMITDVMIGETLEAEYADSFTVARIFSDHMVVQRGEHIRVWGFAPESENGKKVSGSFKGMFAEALIENGEWCITFTARLEADVNGAEMKIYTDIGEVKFTDVLVGDVYLVMGQSNAQYQVKEHLAKNDPATQGGSKADIDPNSIIRLNHLNNSYGTYKKAGTDYIYPDLTNTKFWTKTTEADTLTFSAIGYYFAREMVEKSNNTVPVGLIEVAKGGAPLGSFLPNDLAEKYDSDYYSALMGKYLTHRATEHQGRYLYNCYLSPIQNYAVAGVVWYQGESNNEQKCATTYAEEFNAFIERLRSTHNVVNKDFPVFVVELPSIYKKPADYTDTWHFMELGVIRSYMGLLPTTVKNCYIAASSDVWNDRTYYNNLHPNCKYEQASRLAAIASVVILGKGTMDEANGPVFKSATISADKKTVTITFTNVGEGLTTIEGNTAVKGIVGLVNKDFVYNTVAPVSATITGKDQITVVFSEAVKSVAYNYGSEDYFGETLNLCNSAKIPALAFISPYEEPTITGYTSDKFVNMNSSSVKAKGYAVDTLKLDGTSYFPESGGVVNKLQTIGNTVSFSQGVGTVNLYGWVGFGFEIIKFGYSIDGKEAKFDSAPAATAQAVINAGGQYAKRFNINVLTADLTPGKHTITILALIDLNGGTPVKVLEFYADVEERTPAPAGLDLPDANNVLDFKAWAHDEITVAGTRLYYSNANKLLAADNNRITVIEGCAYISYAGWIGYTASTIDNVGYAIDGNEPIFTNNIANAGDAIIAAGGENAKRYTARVDTSKLTVGEHTVDVLIRVNTANGEKAVYIINSFVLVVQAAE